MANIIISAREMGAADGKMTLLWSLGYLKMITLLLLLLTAGIDY
jgi:hypothetical protein